MEIKFHYGLGTIYYLYIIPDNINLEMPNSTYDNFKDKKSDKES